VLISRVLDSNPGFRLLLAVVFIGLAGFVLFRETNPVLADSNENEQRSFFTRGLLLAALNPQAIPFWIFALAAISQYFSFDYTGISLLGFLLGVFVGKFAALYFFVVASDYLKSHLQDSSRIVNRLLDAILFIIGVSQAWGAL